MPRPRIKRRIRFNPHVVYFKPRGVPMRELEETVVFRDELEAIRLSYIEDLNIVEGSKRMGVSKSTFHRILEKANKKIAKAMVLGKAIRIEK